MPGRVRCRACGEIWPDDPRFCGRCGALLRVEEDADWHRPYDDERPRRRRWLTLLLVLVAVMFLVVLLTGGDPDPPPDDPLDDPLLHVVDPAVPAALDVPAAPAGRAMPDRG